MKERRNGAAASRVCRSSLRMNNTVNKCTAGRIVRVTDGIRADITRKKNN